MKVLILCGSGTPGGNTERMCQVFAEELGLNGDSCEVVRLFLVEDKGWEKPRFARDEDFLSQPSLPLDVVPEWLAGV